MRPIWKGHISFGLINIPIELYSAQKRNDLHFVLLDSRNKARIYYERINEETGEEVPWNEVVKAYEAKDDGYVIMEEEDFKRAAQATEVAQVIGIEDFVAKTDVNPVYYEKPYYLVPAKGGEKGYVLLHEVLTKTKKIAIAKVVIRTRQYLAAVLPYGDSLILDLIHFDQELRKPDEFSLPEINLKKHKITPKEVQIAQQLVDSMTAKWQPKKYHDEYRETLMDWIEAKMKSKLPAKTKEKHEKAAKGGKVINFVDLLKKSLKDKETKKSARKTPTKRTAKNKKVTKTKKTRARK